MADVRDLRGSMQRLLAMVEHDISHGGEKQSFAIRIGLLRDILKFAIEKVDEEATQSVIKDHRERMR